MESTKLTYKDSASFVKTLIDNDISSLSDYYKLEYLRIVGNYTDELGDKIIANNPDAFKEPIIGEDRSEFSDDDLDLSIMSVLDKIFPGAKIVPIDEGITAIMPSMKPRNYDGPMNQLDFGRSGKCLTDDEAYIWLRNRNYPHEYDHIHVYEYDLCLLLPDIENLEGPIDDSVFWIKSDGVREEGTLQNVLSKMFDAYTNHYNEEKRRG